MILRLGCLLAVLVSGGVLVAAGQTPIFTARSESVRIDVLVTERGRVVRGLTAADFEVLDNGVLQQVDFVTDEGLPLSLVIVLDLSDSVSGDRLEHLKAAIRTLLNDLAAEDQVALLTVTHLVRLQEPLTANHHRVRAATDALSTASGHIEGTAIIDAVHAALVIAESAPGRGLVIAFTDGLDTASWLAADQVLTSARRSEVVVYGVLVRPAPRASFVADVSATTGGAIVEAGSSRDLRPSFAQILDEFRSRYLLSFSPRGVAADGWHRLDVRVRRPNAVVKARTGYMASPRAAASR